MSSVEQRQAKAEMADGASVEGAIGGGVVTQTRPGGAALVRQPSGERAVITPRRDGSVRVVEHDPDGVVLADHPTTLGGHGRPIPPVEQYDVPVSLLAGGVAAIAGGAGVAGAARSMRRTPEREG